MNYKWSNNGLGQTYQWDAKNELVGITYSGSAIVSGITQTAFAYDGRGRRVSIVDTASRTGISTKQHLCWKYHCRRKRERR